ncbi:MAG: hypothetical protein JRD89_04145, partial [Deltaproteobacteria bacterium]|nr:hypothetical protein [Deltaproteobacteria bacterium]
MFVLKRLIITAFLAALLSSCVPPDGSIMMPLPDRMEGGSAGQADRSPQGSQDSRDLEPAQEDLSEDSDTETSDQGETNGKHNGQNNQQAIMDEALDFLEQAQLLWEKGEPDNALKLLDQAYSLVLDVNGDP